MMVGDYKLRWDGHGYTVGKPVESVNKAGKLEIRLHGPKYYGSLQAALESLPERMVRERVNACQDLADLRKVMREVADTLVEPARMAVREAPDGSRGASTAE